MIRLCAFGLNRLLRSLIATLCLLLCRLLLSSLQLLQQFFDSLVFPDLKVHFDLHFLGLHLVL
jgi:hypothetical protein